MRRFITLAAVWAMVLMAFGQTAAAQLISHKGVVRDGYDFWVHIPENRDVGDSARIPAVIFLHGASVCGNDLNRVRRYGCIDAVARGVDINAVIIAPLDKGGAWNPRRIMNVLSWSEEHYPIDTNRVYVVGMSLDGYGTIDFAGTYPDKVAAAMAMCGGGDLKDYSGLRNVPLWIIHGTGDRAVSWKASQRVVDEMKRSGEASRVQVTYLKGADHGRPARCFYIQKTYDWLFRHSLTDSLRTLNPDTLSPDELDRAYRNLSPRPLKVIEYSGK